MNPDHVKYDLSHGFPADWGTSVMERQIIEHVCNEQSFDLIVNAVWGFLKCEHPVTGVMLDKFQVTKDLVSNHGAKNILFFNFLDPLYESSTWYEVLDHCKEIIGDANIMTAGFIDKNKFKQDLVVPFWAMYNCMAFTKYKDEELVPKDLQNTFLCYNRKPSFHRKWLHEQFEKHGLLSKGIFTLGNEDPSKVVLNNRNRTTLPFQNNHRHGNLNIPNDTLSVGPLDAWNSSFLIIVTETDHNMNTAVPFLSEKIWKPFIGMRPFVCLGDKGTITTLEEAGFKTFNEFFGFTKKDLTVDDITDLVKNYKGDLAQDYSQLTPTLQHNRKRFFEYAGEQQKVFALDG